MMVGDGEGRHRGRRGRLAGAGGGEELGGVERLAAPEHVVHRPRELVSHERQRLPLAVLLGQAGHVSLGDGIPAQAEDGGLGERPLQMGVADLRTCVPVVLAVGLLGAFHQPAVGHELLHPREAVDIVDLVEEHQGQDLADPRHRAQPVIGVDVMHLGGLSQVQLQLPEQPIVVVDQCQVALDALAHRGIGEVVGQPDTVPVEGDLAERRQQVLARRVLDVREELSALAGEVAASTQKVAGGPHFPRVHVRHGKHAAAQEHGDLVSVDLVILGFAAVDSLHVQGMAEDEGDALLRAKVGERVPREDAFHGHHEVLAVRRDRGEEVLGGGRAIAVDPNLAVRVQHAHVHPSRVQVDPAVVSVRRGVEPHPPSPPPSRWEGVCLAALTVPRRVVRRRPG